MSSLAAQAEAALEKLGKSVLPDAGEAASSLSGLLKTEIEKTGPITVARYMNLCLGHPRFGYYSKPHDIFGAKGDFVTSPEISNFFGQLVGGWVVYMWQLMGKPKKVQLVELGPGMGTLMRDILQVAKHQKSFGKAVTVHMVERSRHLIDEQRKKLEIVESDLTFPIVEKTKEREQKVLSPKDIKPGDLSASLRAMDDIMSAPLQRGLSNIGDVEVLWHPRFASVPEGVPTIVLGHEFLDALPVHQFEFTSAGVWCERLVDFDRLAAAKNPASPLKFKYALSDGPTTASIRLLKDLSAQLKKLKHTPKPGDRLEISEESLKVANSIAKRLAKDTGAALFIDYGENGMSQDTLQAVSKHKHVSVFDSPGDVDLTAQVNFGAIGHVMKHGDRVRVLRLVDQSWFLSGCGSHQLAEHRLKQIGDDAAKRDEFIAAANKIAGPDQMGGDFKAFCAISPDISTPPGFYPRPDELNRTEKRTAV